MDSAEIRNIKGIIFNIQHYSIHDGPGIRTNVFLKGCPLKCLWCANPESQSFMPQLMYMSERCTGCQGCVNACEKGAIKPEAGKVSTDIGLCTACGKCVLMCMNEARSIAGKTVTAGEVFDEVAEDKLFYGSEGGLTVTGGEALAQPEFTRALVELCKEAGINTAIETCGAMPWQVMEPVLQYTDHVLYDIKQMDGEKHRQYTGADNERILENLKNISDKISCNIIVRCPVIPGYNDDAENMRLLGSFITQNKIRCSEVNLLPYHNLGKGKREQLGEKREAFKSTAPSEAELETLRNVLRKFGLIVK